MIEFWKFEFGQINTSNCCCAPDSWQEASSCRIPVEQYQQIIDILFQNVSLEVSLNTTEMFLVFMEKKGKRVMPFPV